MRRSVTFLYRLFLLLFLLPVSSLAAQERNDHGAAALPVITAQQLRDLRAEVRGGRERLEPLIEAIDLAPAEQWLERSPVERLTQRAEAAADHPPSRSLWEGALEHEQAATERLRGALDRADLALAGFQRLDQADQQIANLLDVGPIGIVDTVPEGRSLSEIEADIATLDRRRAQIALERDQKQQTLLRLEEQVRTQDETIERLRQEREAELEVTPWGPLDEPALAAAFDAWQQALDRRTEARVIAAQLDSQTLPARIEILRLEARVLEAESVWAAQRLRQLTFELAERSGEELRALRGEIRRLVERDPEAAERFGPQIELLLQRIDRIAHTQARVRTLQEKRERFAQIETDISDTLASVRERLEIGGLTEILGGLLLEEQRRLRQIEDLRFLLSDLERELAQSRLRDISLRDELRALPPVLPAIADDPSEAELRRLQREVIQSQLQADEQLTEHLRLAEVRLRVVVAQVDELAQLLRESLLWWPSHVPVGIDWSAQLPAALLALLDPASWQEIRNALYTITAGSPWGTLLTVLIAGLLFLWGRGTPQHLARLAEKTSHRYSDRIGLTFQAMGWSLLRVLPVPLLLLSTSLRLERLPEIGPGVEILAAALLGTAIWWLAGHLFLLFTSRNGVGMAHFDWNPLVVRRLRLNLAWYLPAQLTLIIFLALAFGHPSELVFDVFGRMGLLAAVVLTGLFAWRMLAPRRTDAEVDPRQDRRRRLVRLALAAVAIGLIGLTLAGYLLTVSELLGRIINTVVVVAAAWLGYSLAARALVLSETRLAMRRMREQRAKAAALDSGSAVGEGAVIDLPEPHLSVENINQQTRTLLRVTAGAVLVLALLWVWADILPALTWLERVTLWSRTIVVGETEIISRVSLQDFLLAIFLGVLFTLAARNLPGLVEILLSRSTRMDAAGRYTVTTLLRYVLAVVAVISVFSLLGLRWSELQWMVAALTLGLGFGLQEVVANFVSGIIMLFERPVRVGDTITIGEYSGTVARIRTRATTIVDWDNREIVIPNKNFITERLINWTLSDTMTRIVLPVGVSYDADVDEVMETLQHIAEASPLVLKDPPPTVLFLKFGDSALSFEMRVYVDQLKDRLVTISELHQTIIREFRSKGIEIAYPQMDLHIRDVAPMARAPFRSTDPPAEAPDSSPSAS
ncbi:mechanosensitive ion channel domain-containing protein [Thioalkalivibrio paradoxus]|uniref:Small mechanosensitive ion channel protein MscS n=1 Tax=Thioalkalivibrio paradoxus ARh 1 TaxID=713585 RepID=W0DLF8_9GAMM|nr:mechanosensitive ion channel domain-containing protein [Thioalkalivibrio paradoxus]AHE99434.1 small mechanosensitive ion channel protein MscS [Thioalkalivibrio paradoxus ARh 1]